jgi:Tol biopolymer transport system component
MSPPRPPGLQNRVPEFNDRLDSWKEIAVYLNRGVRTVIRWEAEDGLPVHRHVHGSRGSVHAFKSELDAWMQRRTVKPQSAEAAEPASDVSGPERRDRFRRNWLIVAVFGAIVLIAAGLLWTARRQSIPEPAIVPLTAYPGTEMYPTFSPDGTRVAFAWDNDEPYNFDLYEITLGSEAPPLRLTKKPSRHLFPAWSPDGKRIALVRSTEGDHYEIAAVPALGGDEQHVGEILTNSRTPFISWTPDGEWIIAPTHPPTGGPDRLHLVNREGGDTRRLQTGLDSEKTAAFSPDGRWLAVVHSPTPIAQNVSLMPVKAGWEVAGTPRTLDSRMWCCFTQLMWAPTSKEVLYSRLYRDTMSLSRVGIPDGNPVPASGVGQIGWGGLALSARGDTLAYSDYRTGFRIWRLDRNPADSNPTSFLTSADYERSPVISADGKQVAFTSARLGEGAIWVADADGANERRLTQLGSAGAPHWSPDGREIAFDASVDGNMDVYVVPAAGGPPRRITNSRGIDVLPSWSTDGEWIYYASNRGGRIQIWKSPSKAAGDPVRVTDGAGWLAQESPDGRTLYFTRALGSSSEAEIWQIPAAGGEETRIIGLINNVRNFAVVKDGIFYERSRSRREFELLFYRFSDRASTHVANVGKVGFEGLSVSPKGDWFLFSSLEEHPGNLWLVKNLR